MDQPPPIPAARRPTQVYAAEPDPRGAGVVAQTLALLYDSYRQILAGKIFWITLLLSGAVAGLFFFVTISPTGVTVFGRQLTSAMTTQLVPADQFYKWLFTSFAIPFWLSWLATILALVSLSGVIPDLLAGGSIELYVSRPLGRLRLLLTKFAGGLIFAAMQVAVFSGVAVAVIYVKAGSFEPGIFLAVPIVTLFFSYIYSINLLLGLITRSTLASLLLTLLIWGGFWVMHQAAEVLRMFELDAQARIEINQAAYQRFDAFLAENDALPDDQRAELAGMRFQREAARDNIEAARREYESIRFWSTWTDRARAALPKTAETIKLLNRNLVEPTVFEQWSDQRSERRDRRRAERRGIEPPPPEGPPDRFDGERGGRLLENEINTRSLGWVIGTSLTFEAVVLLVAGWIFSRRDF